MYTNKQTNKHMHCLKTHPYLLDILIHLSFLPSALYYPESYCARATSAARWSSIPYTVGL